MGCMYLVAARFAIGLRGTRLYWLWSHSFAGVQMATGCQFATILGIAFDSWLPGSHPNFGVHACTGCQSPLTRPTLILSAHETPPTEPQSLIGCVIIPIYGYDQTHNIEVQTMRAHMDSKTAETPENMPKMP